MLEGHKKSILCLDVAANHVVTGGADRIIKLFKLGPFGLYRTIHTLSGHRQRVLCIKLNNGLIISGSADRSARIWDMNSGHCLRVLIHEMEVELNQTNS